MPSKRPPSEDPTRDVSPTLPDHAASETIEVSSELVWRAPSGYELGEVLGRGGMGEVVLARELELGRGVAIKRMVRAPSRDAAARFMREVKIQARLDHPAIVPVYALGRDADGQPYFTMKRLAGTTLLDVLRGRDASRARLLRAFVDVCRAIDFAHSRGVVHRDLKPANIMLGDFGEVYVIDWGVARVLESSDIDTLDVTNEHPLLGTPGYLAPEQVVGEPLTTATDVYALGAILFEILVRERLHPSGQAGLDSTRDTPTVAPSTRAQIPPELDLICVTALAREPTARPSARSLADNVQRFLDGDRDIERRRQLALAQLDDARRALATGRRADAMRAAGRALALDPESAAAAGLVSRLVLEPPRELPPELVERLRQTELDARTATAHNAVRALAGAIVLVPLFFWHGVVQPWLLVFVFGWLAMMAVHAYVSIRLQTFRLWLVIAMATVPIVLFSRFASPFFAVPAVVTVVTMSMVPQLTRRHWLAVLVLGAAMLAPLGLEQLGVFDRTWSVEPGRIELYSTVLALGGASTVVLAVAVDVAIVVIAGAFAISLAQSRRAAQRTVEIQAWHLRQLLPDERSDVFQRVARSEL